MSKAIAYHPKVHLEEWNGRTACGRFAEPEANRGKSWPTKKVTATKDPSQITCRTCRSLVGLPKRKGKA